jgi:hypothetical protein
VYLNGVSTKTYSGSSAFTTIGNTIGGGPASEYFTGYLSNIHIVNGTALYTSNFTPSTSPLTAIANTSLLLKCDNAGIIDAIGKNDLVTYGNAQISTAKKKYGTGSMYFDGSNGYLVIPHNTNLNMVGGNFTIEFWANFAANQNGPVISKWINGKGEFYFGIHNSAVQCAILNSSSAGNTSGGTFCSAGAFTTNVWNHWAAVRNGDNILMFKDGVLQSTTSFTGNIFTSDSKLTCGYNLDNGWTINGYIDDLRITKGKALYTSNFTPPSTPLTP